MKKSITTACIALAGMFAGSTVLAQTNDATEAVNVSIDLSASVISIDLGGTPDVEFVYADAADYTATQTVDKPGHLTVVSNGAFNISVAAEGAFTSTGSGAVPELNIVNVSVGTGSTGGGTLAAVDLTESDALLVENATASNNAVYDITYEISDTDAASLVSLPQEVYSTTVIYTATQL